MIGLPKETHENIVNTVDFLNMHKFDGIKIHSTYVIKDTRLAELFYGGKYEH